MIIYRKRLKSNIMELVIKPLVLTFITTYTCTASCKDCCFGCNPNRNERLTEQEIIKYIDMSIKTYPSIKLLVLTGGECFLFGKKLDNIINHAFNNGLFVRVVTNGYWASNYKNAYNRLSRLSANGLKELNLSTGDDHIEFVPKDRIVSAARASMDLGIKLLLMWNHHLIENLIQVFYITTPN